MILEKSFLAIMGRRSARSRARDAGRRAVELEPFLSPEAVFSDPLAVVGHPALSMGEKRAILARWLARICRNVFIGDPMPHLQVPAPLVPAPTPRVGPPGSHVLEWSGNRAIGL